MSLCCKMFRTLFTNNTKRMCNKLNIKTFSGQKHFLQRALHAEAGTPMLQVLFKNLDLVCLHCTFCYVVHCTVHILL